jgi:opacity protein-like surface antigen
MKSESLRWVLVALLVGLGQTSYAEKKVEQPNIPTEIKTDAAVEVGLRENSLALFLSSGFLGDQQFNDSSARSYSVIPAQLSLLWTLDEISNDDVLWGAVRGNTSFRFSSFYQTVVNGPETRFVGFMAGPQYNFVQPKWKVVPFVGAQVGLGFTDSRPELYAQGQDFCFTFQVNAGARYFFDKNWSLALEVDYQHYSNGGLSEPAFQNTGLDLFGPQASIVYAF